MHLTIFGTGYVGLVQGAALAEVGHQVICVDIDADKIERLNQGLIPIYEPGLEALVKENCAAGRLHFTTDAASAVAHAELQFIAVGTPADEDGSADLQHVLAVAEAIGSHMNDGRIIVTKSTVPVGTADLIRKRIQRVLTERERNDLRLDVVSNPEFLKEGNAVADIMKPDRIIIGADSDYAENILRDLYAPFNRNHDKILRMDVRSAELTKYAANGLLATKISFMNEMAVLADRLGADIEMVRRGIGSDPRIGYQFIYPGVGYGGSCFPKDVRALISTAKGVDFEPRVLQAVEARNDEQKKTLFQKIQRHYDGELKDKTFALWGLAFKPNTDDMREAPSRVLIEALWQAGARVQAFDPEAMEEAQRIYGNRQDLIFCGTKESALRAADALVIVTEWQVFRAPDLALLKRELKEPLVFDGRNLYEPESMAKAGFTYYSVGRSVVALNSGGVTAKVEK